MIVSLCGTNGSGKSTVVRQLMAKADECRPLYGVLGARFPEAYHLTGLGLTHSVYALGSYVTPSNCGFDGVKDYAQQPLLVKKYAAKGHVVFEGLLSGKLWGRVGSVLEGLAPKQGVVRVYLNTSLEECIRRVEARRIAKADNRVYNSQNLRTVYKQVVGNRALVLRVNVAGLRVLDLSSEEAADRILTLLEEGEGQ